MGHWYERPQLFMIEDLAETTPKLEEERSVDEAQPEIVLKISFHTIAGASHPQNLC